MIGKFPVDFVWGASTSAAQIEGDSEGRLSSIWDAFCKIPGKIAKGHDLRVACDHINRYRQDVALMRQLGLKAYRFSIAPSRAMQEGRMDGRGQINPVGASFYSRLVDELLDNGIEPWPTLDHWDLPLWLEHQGGWLNRDTAKWYGDYAFEMGRMLGDRVKHWMTKNEPNIFAFQGYKAGEFAPGQKSWMTTIQVVHHLLLSHGYAMQALRDEVKEAKIGIVMKLLPVVTLSTSPLAQTAAYIWRLLGTKWFFDPLLLGKYPGPVQAIYKTLFPKLIHSGDMAVISKPMDFVGIDYYFRQVIGRSGKWLQHVPDSAHTGMDWEICAPALTRGLIQLKDDYGLLLPPVYITENGAAFPDIPLKNGRVQDARRLQYLHDHILAVWNARNAGVDVKGYFVWSLLDNFEWSKGFSQRFGLVHVDFETQERTLKDSAFWYAKVIANSGLTLQDA